MNDSILAPNFNISSSINSSLEDLERQIWLIDHMLLMPKHEAWIRREVQVKRAAGTTRIEGATLDEAAVGQLVSRGSPGQPSGDERANLNALRAYEFINFLSDHADIPIDELVIRELNRYFLSGESEVLTPGVYRRGQNMVGRFRPPDQGDVPGLMRSFTLWLRESGDEIHPIIKAGVAHIHLIAIHPFWDGNGRTARGLATLIIQRSPFNFRKLLSLESHMFDLRDDYFSAIERTLGVAFDPGYDATPWLEFFTDALHQHVYLLVAELTDWHRMMEEAHRILAAKGWNQRQADAFAFAFQAGQMTRSDYIEITGVSPATASRDLAEMVDAGLLTAEGKTRSRVYRYVLLGAGPVTGPPKEQLRLLADGA
jgi:Fic family protein